MTSITRRRGIILVISLLACVVLLNALRPAYGRAQEEDLKKQVESLSKKVEDQKKQLDLLTSSVNNFNVAQTQWDKDALAKWEASFKQQGVQLAVHNQQLATHEVRVAGHTQQLLVHTQQLATLNKTLTDLIAQLRARRIL